MAVSDAEDAARGIHGELRGQSNLTASIRFGRLFVTDLLVDFLRRYPAMQVMTLYVDRIVQLAEENQDVAVRIGHLADSTLRATRVGIVRRVVCGAPAYFETRGLPRGPEDLDRHETIGTTALGAGFKGKLAGTVELSRSVFTRASLLTRTRAVSLPPKQASGSPRRVPIRFHRSSRRAR